MKQFILSLTLLLCVALNAQAQQFTDRLQQSQTGQGVVTVTQSKEITDLVNGTQPAVAPTPEKSETAKNEEEEKSETEEKAPERKVIVERVEKPVDNDVTSLDNRKKVMRNSKKINGYRVQVFAGGSSREDRVQAEKAKAVMKTNFPNLPVYTHFYSPRWICRIGNFKDYDEANKILKQVKALGYKKACVVKGKISVQ